MSRVVGGAQTLSKMPDRFPGSYPRSLVSGAGPYVTDDWGRSYTDWICGLGAVSLGYHDAEVDRAVRAQVGAGPIFSLPNVELEEQVAEQLHGLIPCADAVKFTKTGSEATEAAIRAARAHTGRELVLQCGYHSWHSWYAATREDAPGVPLAMRGLVRPFAYNTIPDMVTTRPAAVIIEPTLYEAPRPGFLQELRSICTDLGVVLIFDEMVTGFRWHAGGAQSLYGVTPDLATFGKGMGNGYSISALVGRAEPMRYAKLASGTFGGDCIGLAAASATLTRFVAGGVCEHTWEIGRALMNGYNALADEHAAPTRMEGQPPHPRIVWDEVDDEFGKNRHRASLFFQEAIRARTRDVVGSIIPPPLFHPDGINVMLAHDLEDVRLTLASCRVGIEKVIEAIGKGVRELIVGDPISPHPPWRVTQ